MKVFKIDSILINAEGNSFRLDYYIFMKREKINDHRYHYVMRDDMGGANVTDINESRKYMVYLESSDWQDAAINHFDHHVRSNNPNVRMMFATEVKV